MDLEFITPQGKTTTNKEWMKKGNNPYVLDSNGKPVPTNQHHIDQRASGPIIELETSTNRTDSKNLHPFGNKKNPNDPVDHKYEWNQDRQNINKQRSKNDSK